MKKIILLLLTVSLVAIMIACGAEETPEVEEPTETQETDGTDGTEEAVEEEEPTSETEESGQETDTEAEVGNVREDENGTFTLVASNTDLVTQETGPMILNVTQVNAISAQIKGELADFMESDVMEYIQIDMEVENTSEETINFYPGQATITTNTGEQLEPDMWLSDHIEGEFIGAVKKSGSEFFVLENSKAEDIEWVRIIIDAPHNENWDDVGEKLDFKIEF